MTALRHRWSAALALWLTAALGASAQPPAPATPPPGKDAPIECEFRVFDGDEEISDEASIRLFPTGTRENPIAVEQSNGRFVVFVPPAIYDAQVVRKKQGQVTGIRWSERLVVMRYPDEDGRHLEVINFRPRFGALQVISRDGSEFELAAMMPGTRDVADSERRPVGRIFKGGRYQLLVAPAGRYDVRIRKSGAEERWLLDVEVPAERTRLKTADGG